MTQIYRREEQVSPIERYGRMIWESRFEASVPFKDTCSPEYVRLFGMPTVGDAEIDKQMHDQPHVTYMTINQMVEYFKKGVNIRIKQHDQTKVIYDILTNYLTAWKVNLENGINIGDTPIDDLMDMDRFAAMVYPHAQQHFTLEYFNHRAINAMNGGGMWKSRENLFRPKASPDAPVEEPKKRESMASLFSAAVFGGSGYRVTPATVNNPTEAAPPPARWQRGQ